MTPNDAQIDILLRRYAGRAEGSPGTQHLDADEFNAFAEGGLPPAARSRYVSHVADCHDCRELASQLAIASGAVAAASATTAVETKAGSWGQRLAGFFRLPTLRYAAFALVLVAAVGTAFVVMRRQPETRLAQNESASTAASGAPANGENSALRSDQNSQTVAKATPAAGQSEQNPSADLKKQVSPGTVSLPKPAEETIASAISPGAPAKEDAKRAAAPTSGSGFSPPPPGEAARQAESREQPESKSVAGIVTARKAEAPADKMKAMDQQRAGEFGKDRRSGPNDNSRNQQALNQNNVADATTETARNEPALAGRRARNDDRVATKSAQSADRDEEEKAPETRSVSGHKFRRQGNTWIDAKYKSSMPITDVSRDSDEYRALSSGLKSAVEQFGGGVIVVSKGKAYRIK